MNKKRLDEIGARAEAATPGAWFSEEDEETWQLFAGREEQSHPYQLAKCAKKNTVYMEYWPKPNDSDFITHARQDIPDLLAYVDTLEEIEQIYKRSEEHSAREKGRLLERIEKLEEEVKRLEMICYGYACPRCSIRSGEQK